MPTASARAKRWSVCLSAWNNCRAGTWRRACLSRPPCLEPAVNLTRGARIALGAKLSPKKERILTTLRMPPREVLQVRVEETRPRDSNGTLRKSLREGILAHRPPSQLQGAANGQQRLPCEVAAAHLLVRGQAACPALLTRAHLAARPWEAGTTGPRCSGRLRHAGQRPQARVRTCEPALYHLPSIEQQVPAVCDLLGFGGARLGCPCILTGAVTGDDLDSAMPLEPLTHCGCRTVRQHVDHAMGFQVDEDGAVGPPFAQGPIIHSQHPRFLLRRQRRTVHQPQERIGAGRHRQGLEKPGPRFGPGGHAHRTLGRGQASCPPSPSRQKAGHWLGKGAPSAIGIAAVEAANPQLELNGAPCGWQVGGVPNVAAVGEALWTLQQGHFAPTDSERTSRTA